MDVQWGLSHGEWLDRLAHCPGATYFHAPAWLEGVVAVFGGRVEAGLFRFDDGNWALFPMTIKPYGRGLLQHGYSGETGVYGGMLSPRSLARSQAEAAYAVVSERFPNMQVFGNPFSVLALPEGGGWETAAHSTHVLELGAPEVMRARFSRGCKARGNKARRAGVTTEIYAGPDAARLFYGLYLDSVRRWGDRITWVRPLSFFEAVLAPGEPHAALHVARYQGRPAAVMLVTGWGNLAHYLAGAADERLMEHCPSNLLMEDVAATWAQRGCRMLDLGSSNGLEGVVRFKESFGAKPLSYAEIRRKGSLGRLYFAFHAPYVRLRNSVAAALSP